MASKKILIGGGTGFVGRNLTALVTSNGYEVTNVSRMPATNNISWSKLELSGLPKGTTSVVNLAGQQFMDFTKYWTPGFKQNVQNSRVFTTKSLAKAINQAKEKPKVFVLITGVGAYEPSETIKYDENSPTTGTDFFSRLVVEWEKAALVDPPVRLVINLVCNDLESKQSTVWVLQDEPNPTKVIRDKSTMKQMVIIRSGVVLGRWGGMIKNMFLPFFFGFGGPIGSGKQFLPWIHVQDLVRLILFSIENDKVEGILNGVSPQVITNEAFTKNRRVEMLVGRGTPESKREFRWWRPYKGQERKMWLKSSSSRPHSHTDESLIRSLASKHRAFGRSSDFLNYIVLGVERTNSDAFRFRELRNVSEDNVPSQPTVFYYGTEVEISTGVVL
ncbi:hypothetical protein EVAR_82991_1 [Eumeta japonica]|uniref:NAD-dependent epimerase/dehydratase domain-containing protein n=1 Tax=Eumeta variegata TaxID=151549 RepID=A0A4C1VQU3_EUMVA|nr:hypothetical protein EVAR_82991_1 [Eumeta japonica]